MDQVNLRRLMGFAVSPDGTRVVMAVRATDYEANKGKIDLWHVKRDGTELRQLTSHPAPDTDPALAPDGKSVYFLPLADLIDALAKGDSPEAALKRVLAADSGFQSRQVG